MENDLKAPYKSPGPHAAIFLHFCMYCSVFVWDEKRVYKCPPADVLESLA